MTQNSPNQCFYKLWTHKTFNGTINAPCKFVTVANLVIFIKDLINV